MRLKSPRQHMALKERIIGTKVKDNFVGASSARILDNRILARTSANIVMPIPAKQLLYLTGNNI